MSERYRVVLIDNPLVSPFPCHTWTLWWMADMFCNNPSWAGEWAGKLKVQKDGPMEAQYGKTERD